MFLSILRVNSENSFQSKEIVKRNTIQTKVLCFFLIFVNGLLGRVCTVAPQAQAELLSQDSAVGFLWQGHKNNYFDEFKQ